MSDLIDTDSVYTEPLDLEAERRVIGACLLHKPAIDDAMALVAPEDFYSAPYRAYFQAICEMQMAQQPVNSQTVMRRLSEMKAADGRQSLLDSIGGGGPLTASVEGVAPEDVSFWAVRVQKKRTERDLLSFAKWAQEQALSNPEDVVKLRNVIEERLSHIGPQKDVSATATAEDDLADIEARLERYIKDPHGISGISTQWPLLDHYIDGLQPGNVYIIYAPSSRFKSFVVANMVHRTARQGVPSLFFSTEMPRWQVEERILQLETAMNFRWLRRDNALGLHEQAIRDGMQKMRHFPVYYNDRGSLDLGYLRSEVMRRVKWNGIQVVYIDLVDHVTSSKFKEDTVAQMSLVMASMKELAKEANLPIVLTSHIAKGERALRNRADFDVEDMKGSSSKYQDVDVAISVAPVRFDQQTYRWVGLSREEIGIAIREKGNMPLMLSVTKNRHGELGQLIFAISLTKGGRIAPMEEPKGYVQAQMADEEEESGEIPCGVGDISLSVA